MPKGICLNTGRTHFKKGHIPWHKGKKDIFSKEVIERMRIAATGRPAWNRGIKGVYHHSPEVRKKISESNRGRDVSRSTRRKISLAQRGPLGHSWRGGVKRDKGYISFLVEGKYIPQHRLIIEQSLGRKLRKGEIIHHKNGIRDDNRLENLEIIVTVGNNKFHNGHVLCPHCNKTFGIK